MQVISLVSTKGGAGKTSISAGLAVELGAVLLDLDPQRSACHWSERREFDTPVVTAVAPDRLRPVLEAAADQGVSVVVVDTPPRSSAAVLAAARVATLIVVPLRPQILDLETVAKTLELLSGVSPLPEVVAVLVAVPPRGPRIDQAREALQAMGVRVCPHTIGHRAAWGDSIALGLTPGEYQPRARAAAELRRLSDWIQRPRLPGADGSSG